MSITDVLIIDVHFRMVLVDSIQYIILHNLEHHIDYIAPMVSRANSITASIC